MEIVLAVPMAAPPVQVQLSARIVKACSIQLALDAGLVPRGAACALLQPELGIFAILVFKSTI